MGRVSKTLYDNIDVENLFDQWHPDVRTFVVDKNEKCTLKVIKNSKTSIFDTSNYNEVLNLANSRSCKNTLQSIVQEKDLSNFFETLKERDRLYPRKIERGFSVEEIFESIKNDDYHPVLFLELNKKHYIIDGRTRFYCCLFLKIPVKVRILSDKELNENC